MRRPRPTLGGRPRAAVLCGSLAAVALGGGTAVAAPTPAKLVEGDVALELQRGAGTAACPNEAALRERAADSFDYHDPFVAAGAAASARIRIEITRQPKGYRAVVTTFDGAGDEAAVSTETHVDCDALGWVVAHRVALAIMRRPAPAPPAPPPLSPPAPAAPPAAASVSGAVVAPLPPRACDERCMDDLARRMSTGRVKLSPFSGSVVVGGLMTVGFSRDMGAGIWTGAAFRASWFSLWLEARGSFPAVAMTFDAERSSTVYSISGVLSPCVRLKMFRGCLFGELGQIVYQLPGGAHPIDHLLVALGPRLGVEIPLGRGLELRAFADLVIRPLVPSFSVLLGDKEDAPMATWQTPVLSGLLGVGFGWSS